MLRVRFALAAAAGMMLAAHGASAQGWYISGSAGGVFPMDTSRLITVTNPGRGLIGPATNTSTFNPGEAVNAAVGYSLPLGFRVEGELGYQHFTANSISPDSTNGTFPELTGAKLSNPSGGDHDIFTATANLFYDLPYSLAGITPYVGAGAGYYQGHSTTAVFLNPQGPRFIMNSGTSRNAVVLGEVGASYALTPSLSLVGSYRYESLFRTSGTLGANIVKIGVRYSFGAPPAPPPAAAPAMAPAPAMMPARSFLVFFDWDQASLTDRARQIIGEAAASSSQVQSTRIEVDGYTDTSGTAQYNQGLSMRRAQIVAAELVKDGVSKAAISIQGFGETHPLVPTAAGVREPQNRRVEIIIR